MKKILSILISLFLLTGCISDGNKTSNDAPLDLLRKGDKYISLIRDYIPREKNINNVIDNKEFDDFLFNEFKNSLYDSYLFFHASVVDYKKLGIDKPEVNLGDVIVDVNKEVDKYESTLNKLHSFDYYSLSINQQYDYDLYEYSLYETIVELAYDEFNYILYCGNDCIYNIIYHFSDFKFYNQESIDDYFILTTDFSRFVDDLITLAKDQFDKGLKPSDYDVDYIVDYLDPILKNDCSFVAESFKKSIENLDFIDKDQKNEYIEKNNEFITNIMIPSLNKFLSYVKDTKTGRTISDNVPCNINKKYAESIFILRSSSNLSVDDMLNLLEESAASELQKMISVLNTDEEAYSINTDSNKMNEVLSNSIYSKSADEILEYLTDNLSSMYPSINDVNYNVKYADKDQMVSSTIAYFVRPPFDNLSLNEITVNPNYNTSLSSSKYITLAHEGFPGHLYEHMMFMNTKPSLFRETQSFIGVTEGWACMAMADANLFSDLDNENICLLLTFDELYPYIVNAICDIGINYKGWNEDKLKDELEKYGFNPEYASTMYESLGSRAGELVAYGFGYSQLIALRNKAISNSNKNFDYVAYHQALLNHGMMPFVLMEQASDEYVASLNK